ncbi:MAG: isoprenyl transferase [Bacteroidia bacterium]
MSDTLLSQLDKNKLPHHIAIIMDGNGRWAQEKGQNRIFGHSNGVVAVRNCVEASAELGVRYLTLYAFSTENWQRPKAEVTALMELLVHTIRKEIKTLNDNNIKLETIGDINRLPAGCYQELMEAKKATKHHQRLTLILALNYSARWDLIQATRRIAEEVENGKLRIDEVDEKCISQHLTTAPFPNPELLIRTSGEYRISNFLLWESAYTELHFSKKLWPDFSKEDLYTAIGDFQRRERRFGKTSEQLIRIQ